MDNEHMNDGYKDLRVILLAKSMRLGQDTCGLKQVWYKGRTERKPINVGPCWIALGHFNSLYTYALPLEPGVTSFQAISGHNTELSQVDWDNRDREESDIYLHPLYIARYRNKREREGIELFWNEKAAFMFVTRVYSRISESTKIDLKQFEDSLRSVLDQEKAAQGETASPTEYLCYHTMELSDLVFVLKSNSAANLLKYIYRLYSCGLAGRIYSYCGVSMTVDPPPEDIIDLCSMRFAIDDPANAHKQIQEQIEKNGLTDYLSPAQQDDSSALHMITGNDDINALFYSIPSSKLVVFLRGLTTADLSNHGINAVTTRLGCLAQPLRPECNSKEISQLTKELRSIQAQAAQIRRIANEKQLKDHARYSWIYSAEKLIDTLVRMSQSCVMDECCYLVLDGIKAFFKYASSVDLGSIRFERAQDFISNLSHLMEHIIRVEGQLVNQPETRPPLYNVSFMMLEYILVFADLCSRYFSLDQDLPGSFSYFLIPKLCQRIKIDNIFFFAGKHTPPLSLLQVEIPLQLLYDPFFISCILCHEVSHHSGERTRCREVRFRCFCAACAFLLVNHLGLRGQKVFEDIYHKLDQAIKEPEERSYFDKLVPAIQAELLDMASNLPTISNWMEMTWEEHGRDMNMTKYDWMKQVSDQYYENLRNYLSSHATAFQDKQNSRFNHFLEQCDDIKDLFKECYADISMILTLELQWYEYVGLFSQELEDRISESRGYAWLVQRTAAVLIATGKYNVEEIHRVCNKEEFPFRDHVNAASILPFVTKLQEYCDHYRGNNFSALNSKYYYPFEIIGSCLIAYLQECRQQIERQNQQENVYSKRNNIRNIFTFVTKDDKLDDQRLRQEILDYRTRILSGRASSTKSD